MSLVGQSTIWSKKSPAQGLTVLRLVVESLNGTAGGLSVKGFPGAAIVLVTTNNTIVIDLPTTFNTLYKVSTNPLATPYGSMLLYHSGSVYTPTGANQDLAKIVWFSSFPDAQPVLNGQSTRIWFTFVQDSGVTTLPTATYAFLELGIASIPVVVSAVVGAP